jgi:glycerol-3-phosphate dehydrogenase subunit B
MAGMAATLFSANRGLSVVQVGSTTEIGFASGLFDLLGIHPIGEGKTWDNPWKGIEELIKDNPEHPYARLTKEDIMASFDELVDFLDGTGLPYSRDTERNASVITHMGTIKTTYCLPQTMWQGVAALNQRQPCTLIDFKGMKGFSSGLISEMLKDDWPELSSTRVTFPGTEHLNEAFTEHMANALVISRNLEKLAEVIKPDVKNAQVVGLPAVLGLYQSHKVASDLGELIGVPVFEVSTMPPSVPGLRLKEAFERGLRGKRPYYFSHNRVLEAKQEKSGEFKITIDGLKAGGRKVEVSSKGVILATGRFMGGGLSADRKCIRETIFNLRVHQPEKRDLWHREDFLDPRGHLINQAGLEIDDNFRPIEKNGKDHFDNLFAAGTILAHQDWKRMKCGVGLSVATAFGAVKAFMGRA